MTKAVIADKTKIVRKLEKQASIAKNIIKESAFNKIVMENHNILNFDNIAIPKSKASTSLSKDAGPSMSINKGLQLYKNNRTTKASNSEIPPKRHVADYMLLTEDKKLELNISEQLSDYFKQALQSENSDTIASSTQINLKYLMIKYSYFYLVI